MESLAIVAPIGRYSSCSESTIRCGRSALCRCCCQSLPCSSSYSKTLLVSKVCFSSSNESPEERWLGSRSRGIGLRQRPRRNFKEESLRRLVTDIVLCAAPDILSGVVQGKVRPSSEADSLRASPDITSGAAHLLREESTRLRYSDGQDGRLRYKDGHDGAFSSWDGRRVVLKSSADESTWPEPGRREMARNAGGRWFDPLDERLQKSDRLSDSRSRQGPSQHGEGILRDRVPGGGSELLKRGGHSVNGNAQDYIPRHSLSNIPRSELLKIEELRFSGDMREGDTGPQVLNIQVLNNSYFYRHRIFVCRSMYLSGTKDSGFLPELTSWVVICHCSVEIKTMKVPLLQRALFWLGHLPGLSLTGYFGPETTRALQELHYSNGFSSPGVWDFRSQQLLWKHLYPATNQRHPERQMPKISKSERKEVSQHDLVEYFRLVKNASGKAIDDGLRASRALHHRQSKTIREFVASVSSSLPCSNVFSPRVGLSLLTVAVLSIIVKVLHLYFWQVHGQPVRKRVMGWRNSVDWRRPRKANQSPLNVQQRHNKFFQNHLGLMSTEKEERTGYNLLDRLVLFDGQLVRGDNPTNAKMLHSTHSQSGLEFENSLEDAVEGELLAGSSRKQVHQSGFNIEGKKKSHGFGQFQKLEADPARKVSLHSCSPVQSEKLHRLTGEKLGSGRSPGPVWASWGRFVLGLFFFNSRGLSYGRPKASSRRAVVRNTSRRTKSPERVVPVELGSHHRSSKFDGGLAAETEMQQWKEENEMDLKKRVDDLHRTVQSVEQTREAAMRALAEEKMHNLELEVKIRRQKETAAALEEEVRRLRDSHEALLASLKKKYSSSAAARAAAALLYQNWDPSDFGARV